MRILLAWERVKPPLSCRGRKQRCDGKLNPTRFATILLVGRYQLSRYFLRHRGRSSLFQNKEESLATRGPNLGAIGYKDNLPRCQSCRHYHYDEALHTLPQE